MNPSPRRFPFALGAAVLVVLVLGGGTAGAIPTPRITGVFRSEACGGDPCEPGVDRSIKQGSSVQGAIQIHVSATNDVRPIEWVRLEARFGDDPQFICLQHWAVGQQSFSGWYEWVTPNWPDPTINSNCIHNSPHYHGEATHNGRFELRLVARERIVVGENPSGHDGFSNVFTLEINNAPAAPVWVSDPAATSGDAPAVTLQWKPNTERDLVEYIIVRRDPSGRERETPVSASRPSAQDCARLGDAAIKCTDRSFRAPVGGTYTYAVTARRRAGSGGVSCALKQGRCIESPLSAPKAVTIAGPAGRTPTAGPIATPGALPSVLPTLPSGFGRLPTIIATPTPTQPATPTSTTPTGATQPLPSRGLLGPAAFGFGVAIGAYQLRRALLARR